MQQSGLWPRAASRREYALAGTVRTPSGQFETMDATKCAPLSCRPRSARLFMNKFSIDEAASQEIRRILNRSECQDPVASIGEVMSWRFSGLEIYVNERAAYRSEHLHEVSGITFVLGAGPEVFRGLRLTFEGDRFLLIDPDNTAHNSLRSLPRNLRSPELKLTIHAESRGGRVILHCVLRNDSATAADVDGSTLPWLNSDRFSIDVVDASSTVIYSTKPTKDLMSRRASPPKPMAIAPGESMEGEIDLEAMPLGALPRNVEVLLLWTYRMCDSRDDVQYMLSGKILLEAKS